MAEPGETRNVVEMNTAHIPEDVYITCMSLSSDGKTLISGHATGVIRIWNTLTEEQVRVCEEVQ